MKQFTTTFYQDNHIHSNCSNINSITGQREHTQTSYSSKLEVYYGEKLIYIVSDNSTIHSEASFGSYKRSNR